MRCQSRCDVTYVRSSSSGYSNIIIDVQQISFNQAWRIENIVTNFQKFFGVRHTYKNLHFSIQNYKANEFSVDIYYLRCWLVEGVRIFLFV